MARIPIKHVKPCFPERAVRSFVDCRTGDDFFGRVSLCLGFLFCPVVGIRHGWSEELYYERLAALSNWEVFAIRIWDLLMYTRNSIAMELMDSWTSCKNGEVWVARDPAFVECWGNIAGLLRTGHGLRNPRMSNEKVLRRAIEAPLSKTFWQNQLLHMDTLAMRTDKVFLQNQCF